MLMNVLKNASKSPLPNENSCGAYECYKSSQQFPPPHLPPTPWQNNKSKYEDKKNQPNKP